MLIVYILLCKIVLYMNDLLLIICIVGKLMELLFLIYMYDWCMYLGIKKVY